jgi:hypothetical protein
MQNIYLFFNSSLTYLSLAIRDMKRQQSKTRTVGALTHSSDLHVPARRSRLKLQQQETLAINHASSVPREEEYVAVINEELTYVTGEGLSRSVVDDMCDLFRLNPIGRI